MFQKWMALVCQTTFAASAAMIVFLFDIQSIFFFFYLSFSVYFCDCDFEEQLFILTACCSLSIGCI